VAIAWRRLDFWLSEGAAAAEISMIIDTITESDVGSGVGVKVGVNVV